MKNVLKVSIFILLISCHRETAKQENTAEIPSIVQQVADEDTFRSGWSNSNTLVCHFISEPENLHPTNGSSSPRSEIMQYLQLYLINVDFEEQKLTPGLVKAMPQISSDGLQYTYELRDEPTWDNGEKLSVADVIFTAKACKCPLTNNPSTKSYWQNLSDILTDTKNPNTFTLVMAKKNIQNISFLTSFPVLQRSLMDPGNILSHYSFSDFNNPDFSKQNHADLNKWAAEFNQDKYGRQPEFINGLGPYKVESWDPGISITLKKKEKYWSKNATRLNEVADPAKLIFKINKDDNSSQLEFKSQVMDVSTNLSMNSFIALTKNEEFKKNYTALLSPSFNYTYLAFNEQPDPATRHALFTEPGVRRALALLVPVDQLMKVVGE